MQIGTLEGFPYGTSVDTYERIPEEFAAGIPDNLLEQSQEVLLGELQKKLLEQSYKDLLEMFLRKNLVVSLERRNSRSNIWFSLCRSLTQKEITEFKNAFMYPHKNFASESKN